MSLYNPIQRYHQIELKKLNSAIYYIQETHFKNKDKRLKVTV